MDKSSIIYKVIHPSMLCKTMEKSINDMAVQGWTLFQVVDADTFIMQMSENRVKNTEKSPKTGMVSKNGSVKQPETTVRKPIGGRRRASQASDGSRGKKSAVGG